MTSVDKHWWWLSCCSALGLRLSLSLFVQSLICRVCSTYHFSFQPKSMQTHQNLDSGIIYDCSGSKTHLKPPYSGWRGGGAGAVSPHPKFLSVDFGRKSLETPPFRDGDNMQSPHDKGRVPGGVVVVGGGGGGGVEPPSPSSQWFAPLLTAPSYELSLSSKCAHFGNSYTRFKTLSRLPPPHS